MTTQDNLNDTLINNNLISAAYDGALEKVNLLLARGANVNGFGEGSRTPLMKAAYKGHRDVVSLLLDGGADKTLRDSYGDTAEADARGQGYHDLADFIKNYIKETADEISTQRPFRGLVLEEVFDFVARERISLIRASAHGAVEAMTRDPFDTLRDQSALRRAFNEHLRRGGKTPEAEIFPARLDKRVLK